MPGGGQSSGSGGGSGPGGPGTAVGEPVARGKVLVPTLLVISGIILLFVIFSGIYSDWLWFGSVEKTEVWSTTLITQIGMFLLFGGLMGGAVALNAVLAYRFRPPFGKLTPEQASLERYRTSVEPYRLLIVLGMSGLIGLMTGLSAAAEWTTFQLWKEGGPFGVSDPQFDLDVGFFVFTLPWLRFVLNFAFALMLLGLLTAAVVHYLYGGLRIQTDERRVSLGAQRHLAILGGLILLVKAVSYWVDRYELATASQSIVPGFSGLSYVDVNAVLPSKTILAFAALVVAILFFVTAFRGTWALALIGLALLVVSSIVIGWLYPVIIQYFQVRPQEEQRERPYIERNITATRTAYGLDGVEVQDYAGNEVAPKSVIQDNSGTLKNTRLLDPAVVSPTFRQLQQIRGFYAFPDALDVDRYQLEEGETARGATVAVRELDLDGLPDGQRNWTNDKTVYTHGFGFVSAFDNTARSNGLPSFMESDIPSVGELEITQPRIYFGQMSPEYSIVGAPEGSEPRELDFPDDSSPTGQRNNTYTGNGGVPVGSFFQKLVFATKFQDTNIILSDLVNPESRILFERDPRDRVAKVAPWLTLDGDPYPVVADGRIKWIIDGYTTSNQYPNSARTTLSEATSDSVTATSRSVAAQTREQVTYMRNSIKATVDAYDGTVDLYLWDEADPIAQAWTRVFDGTVKPKAEMPESVLEHVRYPEDIFKVQRTVLSRYHVTDPAAFYSGQDFWIIPQDPTNTVEQFQPPYYLTLQMPGTKKPSFTLTTAFAPSKRPTLAAFMAAESDPGDDYGKIRVLQLPRNTTIPGPTQVQNNFESDTVVAEQLSLLRRGGSDVVLGNLLSLPVAGGMLYVEPVYVRAAGESGFPLLRKVLVGYGSAVSMQDTLDQALADVFVGAATNPDNGGGGGNGGGGNNTDPSTSLTQALEDAAAAFQRGEEALAAGDFGAYGEAQDDLKEALDRAAGFQSDVTGQPAPTVPDDATQETASEPPADEASA
ncbi:MAG: UPF0182 family protein [Actinomycetia bacterium]|nr:UPF0182 family protein [Actinomycetes bacterium]